jgi:hypothetical protein
MNRMRDADCEECRAIRRELRDALFSAREAAGPAASPDAIADYLSSLVQEDCAQMRASSALWKTWRRLMEHRVLTGHTPSLLPLPQGALSNLN